jgi:arginine/lysine/ornithine decarboxylase
LQYGSRVAAVVAVSPTYFGAIQDLAQLAEACHAKGVPLLVDEAHGAHLPFVGEASAVQSGADVAVQSTHKTLTALSQAAMLHQGPASLGHCPGSPSTKTHRGQAWPPYADFGRELTEALSDALELLQSSSPNSLCVDPPILCRLCA